MLAHKTLGLLFQLSYVHGYDTDSPVSSHCPPSPDKHLSIFKSGILLLCSTTLRVTHMAIYHETQIFTWVRNVGRVSGAFVWLFLSVPGIPPLAFPSNPLLHFRSPRLLIYPSSPLCSVLIRCPAFSTTHLPPLQAVNPWAAGLPFTPC